MNWHYDHVAVSPPPHFISHDVLLRASIYADEIGIDADQLRQIRLLQVAYRQLYLKTCQDIATKIEKLDVAVCREVPDPTEIDHLLEELGQIRVSLDKEYIYHTLRAREILRAEQGEAMRTIYHREKATSPVSFR